jgi:drug/metabolite transporter (DMT)-like permease
MNWKIFIFLSLILYAVGVVLQRLILRDKKTSPIAFAIVFQFLNAVFIFAFFFLFFYKTNQFNLFFNNLFSEKFGYYLLMFILYALLNIFMYKALKHIQASVFTVITSLKAFITVLFASFFLNEKLTLIEFLGAILIFISIYIVNSKGFKFKLKKGEIYAFLAAFTFGLVNTLDRYLIQANNEYIYAGFAFLTPSLLIMIFFPSQIKEIKYYFQKSVIFKFLALILIYSISATCLFLALRYTDNASKIASVNISSVILIVILSIIFLKERDNLIKKLVAAGLCFLGVWLLVV